jgi:D-sedoheptulose 7-phosphate isomerase
VTLRRQLEAAQTVIADLGVHETTLLAAAAGVIGALQSRRKLLTCGNGGSAAEAQHLATELTGRFRSDRASLPAITLGGDLSLMSCIANDFHWDEVFARPLDALGQAGDVLVCLSSSGQSSNIVRVLERARTKGIASLALLGKGGGAARGLATWEIIVDSNDTARVQEAHLILIHWLCDQIEKRFGVNNEP